MSSFEGGYKYKDAETGDICPDLDTLTAELHNALNPCIPGAQKPSEEPYNPESPANAEVAFIDPNPIIDREEGFSERLSGSAKKVGMVMALVTALSALSGYSPEAQAVGYRESLGLPEIPTQTETQNKYTEQTKQQAIQVEKQRVTGASSWANEYTKNVSKDMKQIRTAEDAEWLVRAQIDGFADDFYNAPKNASGRIMYNTERIYTAEDARFVIECAKNLKGVLENLQKQYGVESYEKRQERLDKVISNLEIQTTDTFQMKQNARLDVMRHFRSYKRY